MNAPIEPDHAADAWENYAHAMREMPNLGAHLQAAVDDPAALRQAARCARIIAALAQRIAASATLAAEHTDAEPDDVPAEVPMAVRALEYMRRNPDAGRYRLADHLGLDRQSNKARTLHEQAKRALDDGLL